MLIWHQPDPPQNKPGAAHRPRHSIFLHYMILAPRAWRQPGVFACVRRRETPETQNGPAKGAVYAPGPFVRSGEG
jgi:hypothetical protein